jgi:hypothetical protein
MVYWVRGSVVMRGPVVNYVIRWAWCPETNVVRGRDKVNEPVRGAYAKVAGVLLEGSFFHAPLSFALSHALYGVVLSWLLGL